MRAAKNVRLDTRRASLRGEVEEREVDDQMLSPPPQTRP